MISLNVAGDNIYILMLRDILIAELAQWSLERLSFN